MEFVVIPLVSAAVAALTLVSGFGLGTLLLPAFSFFFPVEIAVAATGVVHFTNNLFKLALVGKWADRRVVLSFGVPAVIAAIAGAALMTVLAASAPLATYRLGPLEAEVSWLKVTIGALLIALAALELWPRYAELSFPAGALPIGGALSGFFGGLSGMQGALRAPFLLRAGLSREGYIGTANVISTVVDLARLGVYTLGLTWLAQRRDYTLLRDGRTLALIVAACVAGFLGSYLGSKVVRKVTLGGIRIVVGVLLVVIGVTLGAGVL